MTLKLIKRPPRAAQQHRTIRSEVIKRKAAVLDGAARRRGRVVAGWEHSYDFSFEMDISDTLISSAVFVEGPTAEQAGVTVWHLLSKGTDVRYAQLSGNWQSKTKAGQFKSGPGRGQVVGINKDRPQPGIEPRNWDEIENEETDERMDKAIRDGYSAGAKKI